MLIAFFVTWAVLYLCIHMYTLIQYFRSYGDLTIGFSGKRPNKVGIEIVLNANYGPKTAVTIYIIYMLFWQVLILGLMFYLMES